MSQVAPKTNSIIAFLQARMSSSRLPGKALLKIGNQPMIHYILQQLTNIPQLTQVILLTSEHDSDIPLVQYAKNNSIEVFRGPLENVALRFYQALKHYQPIRFVRLNGDSPLFHREVLQRGLHLIQESPDTDFITNVHPRTFPSGVSFEILSTRLFLKEYSNFSEANDFEHVTQYFYRNHQCFNLRNIASLEDLSALKFAVDTNEDLERARAVFGLMNKNPLEHTWDEYVQYMKKIASFL